MIPIYHYVAATPMIAALYQLQKVGVIILDVHGKSSIQVGSRDLTLSPDNRSNGHLIPLLLVVGITFYLE